MPRPFHDKLSININTYTLCVCPLPPPPCRPETLELPSSPYRVSITISHLSKHNMPVSKKCPWRHIDGITTENAGCTTVNGRPLQNWEDTLNCLQKSGCHVTDDRLQMLVLRDPRAVVVSSYFYLKIHHKGPARLKSHESVNIYALKMLPTICRFVHLRYELLKEQRPNTTFDSYFNETLADPHGWHQRWFSYVGLHLPESVVHQAADTAVRQDFAFTPKGIDTHQGGKNATAKRTYENEISPLVKKQLDDICRLWLPPVLLDKFGVSH